MPGRVCVRCKGRWPTIDNELDTTFWGLVQRKESVERRRTVRLVLSWVAGPFSRGGSRALRSDEEQELCSRCWRLLFDFLQGRPVAPLTTTDEGGEQR